jgi:hypothetical protein
VRARNIKPGFFANESLVELPFEYRLLFIGLWTVADKSGRLDDRPKKIKMLVFPADAVDVNRGLTELERLGFIVRYKAVGANYIQIVNWDKHQNPHHTERASTIPPFVNGEVTVNYPCLDGGNPPDSLIPDSLIPDSKDMCVPVEKKSAYPIEFEAAWKLYPKKTNKGAALKAWKQAVKRDMPVSDMPRHIESRMFEPDWRKEDGRFVPHFSTWLNADGWLDEGAAITPPQDDDEPTYGLDFYDGAPEHMRPKPPKPKAVLS